MGREAAGGCVKPFVVLVTCLQSRSARPGPRVPWCLKPCTTDTRSFLLCSAVLRVSGAADHTFSCLITSMPCFIFAASRMSLISCSSRLPLSLTVLMVLTAFSGRGPQAPAIMESLRTKWR